MSTPQMACAPSYPNDKVVKGNNLTVYVRADREYRKLTRPTAMRSASIPVQLTESEVELRDGSANYPIILSALQKSNLKTVSKIMIQDANGKMYAWDAANFFGRQRVVVIDGSWTLVNDHNTDLFVGSMCAGDCNSISGMIGYKEILIECPGQPPTTAIQLVKMPGCCVTPPESE